MRLFGPVLFYDLIRMARRSRYLLLRCLYALLLLGLLWMEYQTNIRYGYSSDAAAQAGRMAAFATGFFKTFMIIQFLAIMALAPAYAAGAIADEKQRKTLEFLLATDLRNREIVLGKLVSRLANLTLFLLAGLPILSLTQLFGGVSPELLWAGFAATAVTTLSVVSLSILLSVYAKSVRDALMRTYLILLCYLIGTALLYLIGRFLGNIAAPAWIILLVGGFADGYNAGNPVMAMLELENQVMVTGNFLGVVWTVLGDYALFHFLAALACVGMAVLRVRPVYIQQTFGATRKVRRLALLRPRPAVTDTPMLWKELHCEGGRHTLMAKIMLGLLTLGCLTPGLLIVYQYFFVERSSFEGLMGSSFKDAYFLARHMNEYVRLVGTILACILLLVIAVRAAGGIGAERDKQTLDSLLASSLTEEEILRAKWHGSIYSQRWVFLVLGLIWGLGVATGGLHPLAFPLLVSVMGVYTAFFASLGLMFSVGCKTTMRATLWTIGASILVGGGHWFLTGMCCFGVFSGGGEGAEHLALGAVGSTPAAVLFGAAFWSDDLRVFIGGPLRDGLLVEIVVWCLIGLVLFGFAAGLLWNSAVGRFCATSGRIRENTDSVALVTPPRTD